MKMLCETIRRALEPVSGCTITDEGAEITTHCMYPGFEPVRVYVYAFGSGYRVHDGGGAEDVTWRLGRDTSGLERLLPRVAVRYGIEVLWDEDARRNTSILGVTVESIDWLPGAILAVANASAAAASTAIERAAENAESKLKSEIFEALARAVPRSQISSEYQRRGRSGKMYNFDFGVVLREERAILVNGLTPAPASIYSKYVSFADVDEADDAIMHRFAVHEVALRTDDVSLMAQVAELVPLIRLESVARRAFSS